MHYRHMLMESPMFPKALPTAHNITSKSVLTFMHGSMPLQSRPRDETFATTWPCANVFPNFGVRRLDMVLQMGVAKEGFGTRRMGADKGTRICV